MAFGTEVLCPSLKKTKRGPKDGKYIIFRNDGMLPCSNFKSFTILGETSADLIVEQFHASKAVKVGYHLILLRGACIKIGEDPVIWNAFLKFASMPRSGVQSIMVMTPAHPHLRSGIPTEEAIPLLH
jgi:hypothetical protein